MSRRYKLAAEVWITADDDQQAQKYADELARAHGFPVESIARRELRASVYVNNEHKPEPVQPGRIPG